MNYEEAIEFITGVTYLSEDTVHMLLLDPDFEAEFNLALRAIFWQTHRWCLDYGP